MKYIDNKQYINKRNDMVSNQIIARNIKDTNLIEAMLNVPRHIFVPEKYMEFAYDDGPLPIGYEQTISQPYIVALMTELLELNRGDRVLEIGTGSGYQAAILYAIGCEVYTVEIIEPLGKKAKKTFDSIGYDKINCKIGDGYEGWEEYAPFDKIIVTAAPRKIPEPLIDQLALGGKMVIPVKNDHQELKLFKKTKEKLLIKNVAPVMFVPMTGEAQISN
ncbi:MAG: protein-L-isoaspartate(D-aspartate) O-methyltransferase [Thermodesulfobacteriota bacterium]